MLGSKGPAVPVETTIGAAKPSLMGRMVGQKSSKGVSVYVCCPECAAKVKQDQATYVARAIVDRGSR